MEFVCSHLAHASVPGQPSSGRFSCIAGTSGLRARYARSCTKSTLEFERAPLKKMLSNCGRLYRREGKSDLDPLLRGCIPGTGGAGQPPPTRGLRTAVLVLGEVGLGAPTQPDLSAHGASTPLLHAPLGSSDLAGGSASGVQIQIDWLGISCARLLPDGLYARPLLIGYSISHRLRQ